MQHLTALKVQSREKTTRLYSRFAQSPLRKRQVTTNLSQYFYSKNQRAEVGSATSFFPFGNK